MPAKRLLVSADCIRGGEALLTGDVAHHVQRVLRLGIGEPLVLADGAGHTFTGRIAAIDARGVHVQLDSEVPQVAPPEPRPRLTLIYGLARGERTEWVLQKSTELGVGRLLPAICQRSVARPQQLERKRERWNEIVRQATRQAGRSWLPEVALAQPLPQALAAAAGANVRLIADPDAEQSLSGCGAALAGALDEVAMAIGPEGGFTAVELQIARDAGFIPVRLGPLVLRTETAAVALLAVVAHLTGRLEA